MNCDLIIPDNKWGKAVEQDEPDQTVMRIGRLTFPMEPEHYDTDAILAAMDAKRIDLAAISRSPMLFHYRNDAEATRQLCCRINDHLLTMADLHPTRFRPLATLPMQDPAAALAELERVMALGMAGIEIETNVNGKNLDASEFRELFRSAARLGAVVFLHPAAVLGVDRLADYYLANLIGNPTDTAVAAAS